MKEIVPVIERFKECKISGDLYYAVLSHDCVKIKKIYCIETNGEKFIPDNFEFKLYSNKIILFNRHYIDFVVEYDTYFNIKTKKKLYISQPMRCKTDEEIKSERIRICRKVQSILKDYDIEIVDSFIENVPKDAKPLWYLGESIKSMANADIVYFAKDWKYYRECKVEHDCAVEYRLICMYD